MGRRVRHTWHWQRTRIVIIGAVGSGLALMLAWLIPLEHAALAAAKRESAQLEAELHFSPIQHTPPDIEADARNNLLVQFPSSAAVSSVLAELSGARAIQGPQVGEIISRPVATDPKLPWAQHEFAVPVRGSFADARRLLSVLLTAHPTLALDSIEVRRIESGMPGVEAQLRFSLFHLR